MILEWRREGVPLFFMLRYFLGMAGVNVFPVRLLCYVINQGTVSMNIFCQFLFVC